MAITQVYKTSNGTTWDTKTKAIIADTLEQSSIYIEQYKFASIVEAIAEKIVIIKYLENEEVKS